MSDRFDLEQNILDCWKITDDINLLYELILDTKDLQGSLDKDKVSNILLGIKSIYELRFEKTWSTFETLVRNREI